MVAAVQVSNATIVEWQQKYDTTMHALSDDEEEADMERLNTQIQALLFKAGMPAYNATQARSPGNRASRVHRRCIACMHARRPPRAAPRNVAHAQVHGHVHAHAHVHVQVHAHVTCLHMHMHMPARACTRLHMPMQHASELDYLTELLFKAKLRASMAHGATPPAVQQPTRPPTRSRGLPALLRAGPFRSRELNAASPARMPP